MDAVDKLAEALITEAEQYGFVSERVRELLEQAAAEMFEDPNNQDETF